MRGYANDHGLKFSTDPDPKKSKTRCLAFLKNESVKNKRAAYMYIEKNNDIQEFNFAHPKTRSEVDRIENSHFYRAVLWNLASKKAVSLEKSWNVSLRRMFSLPREAIRPSVTKTRPGQSFETQYLNTNYFTFRSLFGH